MVKPEWKENCLLNFNPKIDKTNFIYLKNQTKHLNSRIPNIHRHTNQNISSKCRSYWCAFGEWIFFSTNQTKIIWLQRSNELIEAPAMIEVFIIRIINDHHHYISSFSILSEEYTHTHAHITFSFHSLSSSLSLRMNVCCWLVLF